MSLEEYKEGLGYYSLSWCGGTPLKGKFPKLYDIACNKEASVAQLISFSRDSYH